MRIVCVSATLPNIDDIASFIDTYEAYEFDDSYRPVPLTTHVVGLGYVGKNQFLFDKGLNKHVYDLLKRFSNGKPSIVFCHTKKQTEALASELSVSYGDTPDTRTAAFAKETSLTGLKHCINRGIAYHHAGMDVDDRHLVEKAFSSGAVKCLCATSTLAMGVNLPAHLVIIKGTTCWRGSGQGYHEIDSGTLLQMMGRAGRPGFDTTGTAVIMTDMNSKENYERLSGGLEIVESMLLKNLIETLNTEISQSVINNVSEALDWLKGTFFYIRVRKNPRFYKLFGKNEEDLEKCLMKLCMDALENLHSTGIIHLNNQGSSITAKQVSHIMSRHLVPFNTMKLVITLPHDPDTVQILQILSKVEGMHFPVRRAEKSFLNEAHKQIKYKLDGPPSKVRIQTPSQKAFVLLQCAIGQIYLQDYSLRQEMSMMVEYSKRMLLAFEDYSIEESRHGKVALECMLMRRRLAASLWGSGDCVLNQIQGVGLKTAGKLSMNGIRTFADILSKSSNAIENACGRPSPFGQQLRIVATKILRKSLCLSANLEDVEPFNQSKILVVRLTTRNEKVAYDEESGDENLVTYTLSVHTDKPGGSIMFRKNIIGCSVHKVSCPNVFGCLYIRLVANLVGLDESLQIEGDSLEATREYSISSPKKTTSVPQAKKPKKLPNDSKLPEQISKMKYMVSSIADMRMKKKGTGNTNATVTMTRTPTSNSEDPKEDSDIRVQHLVRSIVTPSPHLNIIQPVNRPTRPDLGENFQPESSRKLSFSSKRMRLVDTNHNSWQREKKQQHSLQQRAFKSPRENPFSQFKYDPNDVEKVLEQETRKSENQKIEDPFSVLPMQMTYDRSRSRFFESRRKPIRSSFSSFIGSARRNRVGAAQIPTGQDLLRQKAYEQQSLAGSLNYNSFQQNTSPFVSYSPQNRHLYEHETRLSRPPAMCYNDQAHSFQHPPYFGDFDMAIGENVYHRPYPFQNHGSMDYDHEPNTNKYQDDVSPEHYDRGNHISTHYGIEQRGIPENYGYIRKSTSPLIRSHGNSAWHDDQNLHQLCPNAFNLDRNRYSYPKNSGHNVSSLQGMVITVADEKKISENFDDAFL